MSIEQARSWTGSSPHVTKRLCATIVCFIGVICIFGGYLLGRMSRNEYKRGNDIISYNLTIAADNLYKRAKRIPPKAIHRDSERITVKLQDIFHCSQNECGGAMDKNNLAAFIRNCINNEGLKLMRTIYNATVYLDSL